MAQKIEAAKQIVGSPAHHALEADIAAKAVTLLKDDGILPLSGKRPVEDSNKNQRRKLDESHKKKRHTRMNILKIQ